MKKILSIIIPSYNTEQYIDECLPTMIEDSFLDDIEILLINDGSKDHTAEVAKKYVDKYPNSIRLINKENGGHGSVINKGIEEVSGKYFKVIDGDDWVETDGLKKLVNCLKNTDVDMILNPFYRYLIKEESKNLICVATEDTNKEYLFEDICHRLNPVQIHSVTYKTSLLRNHNIRFQENCFYEDQEYDIYPLLYVDTVLFLDMPVYVYRLGTSTQSANESNAIRNRKMSETIISNLVKFYEKLPNNISTERKNYFTRVISYGMNGHCSVYLKMPFGKKSKRELKEYFDWLNELSKELYEVKTTKVIYLLRKDSWLLYTLAYVVFWCKRKIRKF